MKSKIIQEDREDLIRLCKAMTPEERLVAFYNHSRLICAVNQKGTQLFLRGPTSRKTLPRKLSKNKKRHHEN